MNFIVAADLEVEGRGVRGRGWESEVGVGVVWDE
jgi:biotin-(acetyl-CoA carboxylase) ligase